MQFWMNLGFVPQIEQLPDLAAAAEAAGFEGVAVPHRWIMPGQIDTDYPYTPDGKMFWPKDTPFPDPWVTIAAMAARTSTLKLVSNIYLMGLHDPFTAARLVATASILSRGRVVCGVSAGWMKEEFDLAGIDFKSRGRRLNEMIAAVRALWSGEAVSFEGEHVAFPEVILSPAPTSDIPIWCGGRSRAAMRRAADHCQGWLGLWYPADQAIEDVTRLRALRAESPRADEPMDALIGLVGKPDPATLARLADAGITGIVGTPWHGADPRFDSLDAKLAAIDKYRDRWMTAV